jgi:glycerate-2-kinase
VRSFQDEQKFIEYLFGEGLKSVEPRSAVVRDLHLANTSIEVDGRTASLVGKVIVLAVGKAAVPMAQGCADVLGDRIDRGIILTKDGHLSTQVAGFEVFEARHPLPDRRGIAATQHILRAVSGLGNDDVVIALISGGGSALLEAPVEGIALEDFQETTDLLLKAGAPIQHLNAVRSAISQVKGGGLRRAIGDATCVSLILSDVLGNDPAVIASGPTVYSEPDPQRARALLKQYGIETEVPGSVAAHLQLARPPVESASSGADIWHIVGDNRRFLERIEQAAAEAGCQAGIVWRDREGEARELGVEFTDLATRSTQFDVVIGGGEATVTVRGNGIGGRNTEFALAAAMELERTGTANWVIASLGSDGQDGAADAAGAIADPGTTKRAREQGIDPVSCLQNNDSASLFATVGGLVNPGPTGTNVNDVFLAFRAD